MLINNDIFFHKHYLTFNQDDSIILFIKLKAPF